MNKIGIFMANGCEEIEGLTVVDLARRAGLTIDMISITGKQVVEGSHKISFETDVLKEEADFSNYDGIILPGGLPGTNHLQEDETVQKVITEFAKEGKLVAAICAAPKVLGQAGLLKGKKATCHRGFEDELIGATVLEEEVVVDGNIITSRGMGTAIPFGLEVVRYFLDDEAVDKLVHALIYRQ